MTYHPDTLAVHAGHGLNLQNVAAVAVIPEIEELYQEVILDHSRRPRNFGELPDAAVRVHGDNPACGDEIHLAVKFDAGGGLEDIKFTGSGCAISQASASLMTMTGFKVSFLSAACRS